MDLISIANLGLVNAARRFDPEMENRFLTYAAWWVKQALLAEIGDLTREISVPQKVSWMLLHLDRRASKAELELGRPATDEELAIALETEARRIDRLKQLQILTSRNYLEEALGGAETRNGESPIVLEVEGHEGEYIIERESMLREIQVSLESMTGRERTIVCQHFGLMGFDPETLEEIGRKCDPPISRERVRQLEERAFERLRSRRSEPLGSLLRGPSPFEPDRREMTRGMSAFRQWEMDGHE